MKFYISEVPKEYDDTSGCFEYGGKFYYYELSFINDADLAIKDTCGRYMPLAFKDALNLGQAISMIAPELRQLVDADRARDYLDNNLVVCI